MKKFLTAVVCVVLTLSFVMTTASAITESVSVNSLISEIEKQVGKDVKVTYDYALGASVSNEEYASERSYLDYINADGVWDVTRGEKTDGTKIKVAVIDSGIDTDHPEFYDADGNCIISQ